MEALSPLELETVEHPLFNLDLHSGNNLSNFQSYYSLCAKATDLFVTTSCFAAWKKEKCTNGTAKMIPAVPVDGCQGEEKCCVFFFDDNINLHLGAGAGKPDTKGICNLRDLGTGEYVDFSAGSNGFVLERAHRHTLIHHSTKYRTVLVQANILEAMSNDDYFTSIIDQYSKDDEKLIVYMDVNGTILWSDSIMGLGPSELLLEAMLAVSEVHPNAPFNITWEDHPEFAVVKKPVALKQLMHDITGNDKSIFHRYLVLDKTCDLLRKLIGHARLVWSSGEEFTIEEFKMAYESYIRQLRRQSGREHHGITNSWFRCLRQLQDGGHTAVINSFGMDTQKVVVRSVPESHTIMHVAVNYEMWTERDAGKYEAQFQEALDSLTPTASPKRTGEVTSKYSFGTGRSTCSTAVPGASETLDGSADSRAAAGGGPGGDTSSASTCSASAFLAASSASAASAAGAGAAASSASAASAVAPGDVEAGGQEVQRAAPGAGHDAGARSGDRQRAPAPQGGTSAPDDTSQLPLPPSQQEPAEAKRPPADGAAVKQEVKFAPPPRTVTVAATVAATRLDQPLREREVAVLDVGPEA